MAAPLRHLLRRNFPIGQPGPSLSSLLNRYIVEYDAKRGESFRSQQSWQSANTLAGKGFELLEGGPVYHFPMQGSPGILLYLLPGDDTPGARGAVPVEDYRIHGHLSTCYCFC